MSKPARAPDQSPHEPRAQGERLRVPDDEGEQATGGQHPGQTREQRVRLVRVHEHAVAEDHVEAAGQEVDAGLAAVALDHPDPLADSGGLRRQRLARRLQQLGIGLQAGHGVSGAGQAQRLCALTHARVEDPQPLPHGVAGGYLLVELAGDDLLPDGVAQPAVSGGPVRDGGQHGAARRRRVHAEGTFIERTPVGRTLIQRTPVGRALVESVPAEARAVGAQGRSPRLTCGFGSRRRRIWSVRMRP